MKKSVICLLLTVSFSLHAEDCETVDSALLNAIAPLMKATAIPNCHNKQLFLMDEVTDNSNLAILDKAKNLKKSVTSGDFEKTEICGSCKDKFKDNLGKDIDSKILDQAKEDAYLDVLFKEMEKVVSATLLDIQTQRGLFSTGSDYSKTAQSCNVAQLNQRLSSCNEHVKSALKNYKLDEKIASEVGSLLSYQKLKSSGFIDRSTSSLQCGIKENEVLSSIPLAVEESITPSMVEAISSIDPSSSNANDEILKVLKDIKTEFNFHPVLKVFKNDPAKLIGFFKNLKQFKSQDELTNNLRKQIYNKNVGEILDNDYSSRCTAAFDSLANTVCAKDFKASNISMNSLKDYKKLLNGEELTRDELASSPELIKKNISLLSFCDDYSVRKKYNLSDDLSRTNESLVDSKDKSLKYYTDTRYQTQIRFPMENFCRFLSAGECKENTVTCRAFQIYQDSKKPNTLYNKLASKPDEASTKILRGFINTSANIDPQVKTILIKESLIPQDDGKFVAQTESKRPEPTSSRSYESASSAHTSSNSQTSQAQAVSSGATSAPRPSTRLASTGFNPSVSNSATPTSNDWAESSAVDRIEELSRMSDIERKKLHETENEILRRLTESKSSARPNKEEVNRVTHETLKKNNQSLSPVAQTKLSEQIFEDINNVGATRTIIAPAPQQRESQVGLGPASGPTKSEANWNKALSKMANAEGSASALNKEASRSPASQKEFNTDAQPTLKVTVAKNDLKNIESILTQQLSNKVGDSFKLEIATGSNETLTYEVSKSANGLIVSPLGSSAVARQYLDSVQKVVNKLYVQQSQARTVTRQALLQSFTSRTPSQN